MKSTIPSFVKRALCILIISMLIVIPVFANWATRLTQEEVNLWRMWINLALNGYAEPMPMNQLGEKPWWNFWE